jgi:hypothetical protein
MENNLDVEQEYYIFTEDRKSYELPSYTMVPPCLFNYTYYLYSNETFIEQVYLGDEDPTLNSNKDLYMDPYVTNSILAKSTDIENVGTYHISVIA